MSVEQMIAGDHAALLAALEAGPATLTQLCSAINATGYYTHDRLVDLAGMGLVRTKRIHTYTTKIPISKIEGRSRVVWYLLSQPAPTIDVQRDQKPPAIPKRTSDQRDPRLKRTPFANERREHAEVLAMLAGRTNFLTPNEGRSTDGTKLMPLDVAHGIARASDKFGAAVALAVACQRESEWPNVNRLGFAPLVRELRRQRKFPGVVAGPLKHRARIVLWDAFHDYIRPKQKQSIRKAAKAARIAEPAYRFLHNFTITYLEHHKNTAAGEACFFLFAPNQDKPGVVLMGKDGTVKVWTAQTPPAVIAQQDAIDSEAIDNLMIALLDARGRSRSLGVLHLNGIEHVAVYVNPTEETIA